METQKGVGLTKVCPDCGIAFGPSAKRFRSENWAKQIYCSRTCSGKNGPRAKHVPFTESFWQKVDKRGMDDCWEWTGAREHYGHGRIAPREGYSAKAHRASWEMHNGPIPEGVHVCHHCDNPPCVNPRHLFLGYHADNMADMAGKDRSTHGRGVKRKLTIEQVRAIKTDNRTQAEIAKDYGVSAPTISNIKLGKAWRRA